MESIHTYKNTFSYGWTHSICKFPGQGLTLSHSFNLHHSYNIFYEEGSISTYSCLIFVCFFHLSDWEPRESFKEAVTVTSRDLPKKITHLKLSCLCYCQIDEFPFGFYPSPDSNWNTGYHGRLQLRDIISEILGVIWSFGAALYEWVLRRFHWEPSSCSSLFFCFEGTVVLLVTFTLPLPSTHPLVAFSFSLALDMSYFMLPSLDCSKEWYFSSASD